MIKSRVILSGLIMVSSLGLVSACDHKLVPITAIFMLDTSASSAEYRRAAAWSVGKIADQLQHSIDRVVLYRVNNKVHNLYTGEPLRKGLRTVLNAYMDSPQDAAGTAYGTALQRGLDEAKSAASRGHRVGLFILGDGADERVKDGGNINQALLKKVADEFPREGVMAFMYVDPANGDPIYAKLSPVMGARFKSLTPANSQDPKVIQEIMMHLGR